VSASGITKFGGRGDAAHDYSFEVGGISVLIIPPTKAHDELAMHLAQELASAVDSRKRRGEPEVERLLNRAADAVIRTRRRPFDSPESLDDIDRAWRDLEHAKWLAKLCGLPIAQEFSFLTWVALVEMGMGQ
jgi:hypothetical protein